MNVATPAVIQDCRDLLTEITYVPPGRRVSTNIINDFQDVFLNLTYVIVSTHGSFGRLQGPCRRIWCYYSAVLVFPSNSRSFSR